MSQSLYRSVSVLAVLTLLLCGVYPLAVTLVGQALFSGKANGSLIYRDGKVLGSLLLAQGFAKPEYFHPRPSAAGDKGYDAANSSGSNLGPTNKKLFDRIKGDVDKILKENPSLKFREIPVDMVTTSGSGLDPEISPEAARAQAARVADARKLSREQVRAIVEQHIEGPDLGFLGEPRVNVLALNLALDQIGGTGASR